MDNKEFRLDESRGDVFTQIAANMPANPERAYARRELFRLRETSDETERQLAAIALANLADNPQLMRLADIARSTDEFQTGRRG